MGWKHACYVQGSEKNLWLEGSEQGVSGRGEVKEVMAALVAMMAVMAMECL